MHLFGGVLFEHHDTTSVYTCYSQECNQSFFSVSPDLNVISRPLTKVKCTLKSMFQIYWKYTSKVYLKYTSSILEAYFKYTSSILQVYSTY